MTMNVVAMFDGGLDVVEVPIPRPDTIEEFAQALGHLAAGELQVVPLVISHVGLSEVPDAFARLADPEQDAKIIVVP